MSLVHCVSVDPNSELDVFTDGLWHSIYVDVESGGQGRVGRINITVDGRVDTSNRQLSFSTTNIFYIGGESGLTVSMLETDTMY